MPPEDVPTHMVINGVRELTAGRYRQLRQTRQGFEEEQKAVDGGAKIIPLSERAENAEMLDVSLDAQEQAQEFLTEVLIRRVRDMGRAAINTLNRTIQGDTGLSREWEAFARLVNQSIQNLPSADLDSVKALITTLRRKVRISSPLERDPEGNIVLEGGEPKTDEESTEVDIIVPAIEGGEELRLHKRGRELIIEHWEGGKPVKSLPLGAE